MQAYQLNFLTLLRDWYLDPIIQSGILAWAIFIFFLYIKYHDIRKNLSPLRHFIYFGSVIGFIGSLFIFWLLMPIVFAFQHLGSGYHIKDTLLYIKAPPAEVTLELTKTYVTNVQGDRRWNVVKRTGSGTYNLLTGWCELRNGKKALVFMHRRNQYKIILEQNGQYYVLMHPGVQQLYPELLVLGAKEKVF